MNNMDINDLMQGIDSAFNKKYIFKTVPNERAQKFIDRIHPVSVWYDDELQDLKKQMNEVKSSLSDIDIVTWNAHTNLMHRGGAVREQVRLRFHAELCTQAWSKFYEIISAISHIIRSNDGLTGAVWNHLLGAKASSEVQPEFYSLHLCEAPGAFIASLNHYLVSRGYDTRRWRWIASTLNPYYEENSLNSMIDDDSFIRETFDHWIMGEDNTGNIMNECNINNIMMSCKQKGLHSIQLVTADGSVDCADDPAEQESIVSRLHLNEMLTALRVLQPGGCFVLKMFTLFESLSICIIYILRCHFEKVQVMKPVTSKPGNSEVYIISVGFRGASTSFLNNLTSFIYTADLTDNVPFPRSLFNDDDLSEHRECCRRFSQWQMNTIKVNHETFQNLSEEDLTKVNVMREEFVKAYLERFPISDLENNRRVIVRPSGRPRHLRPSKDSDNAGAEGDRGCYRVRWMKGHRTRHEGTFTERKRARDQTWDEKLSSMSAFSTDSVNNVSTWFEHKSELNLREDWIDVITGKQLTQLCSSKFCDPDLLQNYRIFMSNISEELRCCQKLSEEIVNQLLNEIGLNVASSQIFPLTDLSTVNQDSGYDCSSLFYGDLIESLSDGAMCDLNGYELFNLLSILKDFRTGHHLVLSSRVMLTRMSAAVLRLLCSLFNKVFVIRYGELAGIYFICLDYGRRHSSYSDTQVLLKLCHTIDQFEIDKKSPNILRILSVLSVNCLFERRFLSFIRKSNNDFMILRMNYFLNELKTNC